MQMYLVQLSTVSIITGNTTLPEQIQIHHNRQEVLDDIICQIALKYSYTTAIRYSYSIRPFEQPGKFMSAPI